MSEHLLFLAFPLLSPPLMYKVLNFLYSCGEKKFITNEMEADLDDFSVKILESIGKG